MRLNDIICRLLYKKTYQGMSQLDLVYPPVKFLTTNNHLRM
jgi:hypothetical protein